MTPSQSNKPILHHLSMASFQTLASGQGSATITGELWRTEKSRRLLLLAALLAECERDHDLMGPLTHCAEARLVLGEAQRLSERRVNTIFMHPQVGSWAAYTLRRRRGRAVSDLPMWTDFGVIHSLALVAAAGAGIPWRTRLPVRAGECLLPTLGVALFPDAAAVGFAEAATQDGQIKLVAGGHWIVVPDDPSTDAPGWWGLRRIRTGDELVLDVALDDIDPYRDLADPVPASRLDATGFARWTTLVSDAWSLLCADHRADAEAIAGGVTSIVPLAPDEEWGTRSASTGEAFGSVMTSPPPDAEAMAVTLVHEYQHIKLGALMHLLPLTTDDGDGSLHYAPWRDDPRPLGGLLQGVYAFLGIAAFWRRQTDVAGASEANRMSFEYSYARAQTEAALRAIRYQPGLTPAGDALVAGMTARIASWPVDTGDGEIARLTRLTVDSHRVGWRLRNLRPRADIVNAFAEAWGGRDSVGEDVDEPTVVPQPKVVWPLRFPRLARQAIEAGAGQGFIDLSVQRHGPASTLDLAERALVAGECQTALAACTSAITAAGGMDSDEEIRWWVCLVVAACALDPAGAGSILAERPDLVRAVHNRLAHPTDPTLLAAWMNGTARRPHQDAGALR